ncbi:MAG: hypothetical protein JNL21_36960 [Myxococcales bacterium]|nr:hypothetical protein [Myxococcales bacterium]
MSQRLVSLLLVLSTAGCDLVLGVPNPDEVRSVRRVGDQLCGCPTLTAEATAACEAAVEVATEAELKALAEADCSDCANVVDCYALATDAGEVGQACESHADCRSLACCTTAPVSSVATDPALQSAGACCATCASCGTLLDGGDWSTVSNLCIESADFLDGGGSANDDNLMVRVSECLCAQPTAGSCEGDCGMSCLTGFASEACRTCLRAQGGDACALEISTCLSERDRPL